MRRMHRKQSSERDGFNSVLIDIKLLLLRAPSQFQGSADVSTMALQHFTGT